MLKGQCRGPHVWAGQEGAEGCGAGREVEPCGCRRDLSLGLEAGSQQDVLNRAVAWTDTGFREDCVRVDICLSGELSEWSFRILL